jgi:hypothetical protein
MTVILNDYITEQYYNSFMTDISNMVTYTAIQAIQQWCDTWSVWGWLTHDMQYAYCVQQVLHWCDVLVSRFAYLTTLFA